MTKYNVFSLNRFGEPATLILLTLSDSPKHGYAMLTDIESETGMKLGPGTLYGAITKLLNKNMISKISSPDRQQIYKITDSGIQALREYADIWEPIITLTRKRLA